jgi:hypothetical protein
MNLGIALLITAVAGGAIAVTVLGTAVSLLYRAQNAAFYGLRQDARKLAGQRLVLTVLLALLVAGLLTARMMLPEPTLAQSLWPPTGLFVSATALPEPGPSVTDVTEVTAATPELAPTPRPPDVALPTSTPHPDSTAAPLPNANKRLTFHAVASGMTAAGEPTGVATRFSARTSMIYVFYNYHDVPPRASVRHTWFHNGGSVYFNNDEFDGRVGEGVGAVSWAPSGGFEPGLYEVRIVLGNVPQFVANFEIK